MLKTCRKMLSANEEDKGLMRSYLLDAFQDKDSFYSPPNKSILTRMGNRQ